MDDGIYENCKPTTILEKPWGDSIYHHQGGLQQSPLLAPRLWHWQYLKGSWWPLCPVWPGGDIWPVWPTTEQPFLTGAGGLARQEGTHSSRLQHELCQHLGQLKVTISGTLGFGSYFPCLSWILNVLLHFFSHLSIMPFICMYNNILQRFICFKKTTHAAPHGHVIVTTNKKLHLSEQGHWFDKRNVIHDQELIGEKGKNFSPSLTLSLLNGHFHVRRSKKLSNYGLQFLSNV